MSATVSRPQHAPAEHPRRTGSRRRALGGRIAAEAWSLGPWILVLAGLAVWAMAAFDLPADALGRALIGIALTQVLPGALLWRLVRPRAGWLAEDLVMGLALGAALTIPTQVAAAASGWSGLRWAVPAVLVISVLAHPTSRHRALRARISPLPWWWGPAAVVGCAEGVWTTRQTIFSQPVNWSGWAERYVDVDYHLALIGEVSHRFPLHYPQWGEEPLRYHWFSHAWMGQIADVGGLEAELVLLRVAPLLLAAMVPLALAVAGTRLAGPLAGPLAAILGASLGALDLWGDGWDNRFLTPLSPSQSFGALLLVALLLVMGLRWRAASGGVAQGGGLAADGVVAGGHGMIPVLLLLLAATGGSKGTSLPLVVLGAAAAFACALLLRRGRAVIGLDLLLTVATLAILVRFVYGGDGALQIDPAVSLLWQGEQLTGLKAAPGTSLLIAGVAVILAGFLMPLVALAAAGGERRLLADPALWLMVGITAGGAGAVMIFTRGGHSEWWFRMMSVGPTGLGVAMIAAVLLRRCRWWVAPVGLAVGVAAALGVRVVLASPLLDDAPTLAAGDLAWPVVAFVLIGLALVGGSAAREGWPSAGLLALAFTVGGSLPATAVHLASSGEQPIVSPTPIRAGIPADQVQAARWLRDHSAPDDLVATNRHCRASTTNGPGCDHRIFVVSGFAERSVLLETWVYTLPANQWAAQEDLNEKRLRFWREEPLALNDGFFAAPTPEAAAELWDRGVRWLYVNRLGLPVSSALGEFADLRHQTAYASVLRLRPPGRP